MSRVWIRVAGLAGQPLQRLRLPRLRRSTNPTGTIVSRRSPGPACRLAPGSQQRSGSVDDPAQVRSPLDLVALLALRPRMADHAGRPRADPRRMPLVCSSESVLVSGAPRAIVDSLNGPASGLPSRNPTVADPAYQATAGTIRAGRSLVSQSADTAARLEGSSSRLPAIRSKGAGCRVVGTAHAWSRAANWEWKKLRTLGGGHRRSARPTNQPPASRPTDSCSKLRQERAHGLQGCPALPGRPGVGDPFHDASAERADYRFSGLRPAGAALSQCYVWGYPRTPAATTL
jgi:hypothetical protein